MRDLIEAIRQAAEPKLDEMFADCPFSAPYSNIVYRDKPVTELATILGPRTVTLVGDAFEFYAILDGATNLYPGERWCGATELLNPVRSVWSDVKRFDPVTEPGSAGENNSAFLDEAIKRVTGATPMNMLDLEPLLEEEGIVIEEGVPDEAALTVFGYEMLEWGHHRTCLFFPDAKGSEPKVLSPWDVNTIGYPAHNPTIREFLEVRLSWVKNTWA